MTNRPDAGLTAARKNALARAIESLVDELLQRFDVDGGTMLALMCEVDGLLREFERARASYDGANLHVNTGDEPMVQATLSAACRRHGIDLAEFRAFLELLSLLDDLNPRRVTH